MTEQSWLANYPAHVNWNAEIPVKPLYSIMDESVKRFPDKVATDFLGTKMTYRQLGEAVDKAAEGFRQNGIKKGDTVGILLPNSPQFIASYFGALKAGAKVVALSPLDSAADVAGKVADSEAKMIVTLDNPKLYPLVEPLVGTGKLEKLAVATLNDAMGIDGDPAPQTVGNDAILSWKKLLDNKGIATENIPAIDPEKDVAVLQYTGGTTGKSKGAELTHQNLHANVVQSSHWFSDQIQPGQDKMMGILPFFHIFAMTTVMNFGIQNGLELIVHPIFHAESVLKDIQEKKPTLMPAVPTMLDQLMNHPDVGNYDLSSLKSSISGGMPLTDDTRDAFQKLTGGNVLEGYGLTESSPIAAANPTGGKDNKGVGLPYPGTTIEIRNLNNPEEALASGESGEIVIKGPQVMKGYWKNPEATKNSFTADGFLRTGDIGIMDERGYVVISGRLKEMIITGGFNIYPSRLENALRDHEAVKDVAVIGIPHPEKGQVPKAFVVLHEDADITVKELANYMNKKRGDTLNAYEKIGEFEVMDELPKTPIGKIDKKALEKREAERAAVKEPSAGWRSKVSSGEGKTRSASR